MMFITLLAFLLVFLLVTVFFISVWNARQEKIAELIDADVSELESKRKELIQQIEKLEKQTSKLSEVDREKFYDVMEFMLKHSIISYNEYSQIEQRALPFLKR